MAGGSASPRGRVSLGQHFLTDPNILRRIVDALEPAPGDVVLEIGPGRGSLTAELLSRGIRVVAIERDRRLAEECRKRNAECGVGKLRVVEGDALKMSWHDLLEVRDSVPHWKIVGNIPYYITSPLIARALTPPLPACLVLLVQAEVADRLVASPGSRTYGALSVGVQALCQVEKLFAVKPGSFRPVPRVQSAVVRFRPRSTPLVESGEVLPFRAFVTASFSRRRKQLRNVVRGVTGRGITQVEQGLRDLGLDPGARPETVAVADFVRLWRWSGG